ncbi:IPT/TIG domain-containing protein [Kitasatospora sp. NPDC049258]|uniref:beta strand repeat-containing protein n=1 Tax=Kitasatospora sp. NPDC049258 TaxID=3155394 RepID=UPI0034435CBC
MNSPQAPRSSAALVALVAPTLGVVSPNQGTSAGGTTVTLTGSHFTGATAVKFGATAAPSFTVSADTVITAVSPPGSGTVQVTVTTPGGTSNGLTYTYTGPPAPTLGVISPNQGTSAGGTTVTLTGSHFTGATAVKFGTSAATSFTVSADTVITAVSPPGSGTVQVTVTTPGGTSNGLTYTYTGPPAPTLGVISPNQGTSAGGTTVTLTGTNLTGATAVKFGATAAPSFTVSADTVITAVSPPGSGTVQVTVTTPGGTSNGLTYTYTGPPAPTLGAVSPNQGTSAGGTTVTLTGTNLTTTTAVKFGATPAAFTVVSDTQITAVSPPGGGTVNITVTTPGGTSNGVAYTYLPTPTLTSAVPSQGPVSGGNTVTLTGTNLTTTTAVNFAATAATSFTVVSDTQITATAPPSTAGPVNITVTSPGGTSAPNVFYYYVNLPTLTSTVPSMGPVSGGTTVTLTGTNLTTTTAVKFGATAATSFTVASDTQITAVSPPGGGTVNITATTPGGTSNGVAYTYLPTPTLTSAVPSQGPVSGGTTVTLTGTNLTTTTAVKFGATPAAFTVVSDTQLVATAPPGAAGPVNLTVATPGGTSNGLPYTRLLPPSL